MMCDSPIINVYVDDEKKCYHTCIVYLNEENV